MKRRYRRLEDMRMEQVPISVSDNLRFGLGLFEIKGWSVPVNDKEALNVQHFVAKNALFLSYHSIVAAAGITLLKAIF